MTTTYEDFLEAIARLEASPIVDCLHLTEMPPRNETEAQEDQRLDDMVAAMLRAESAA